MKTSKRCAVMLLALQIVAFSELGGNAFASGGKKYQNQAQNAVWSEECGSCHFAYPAGMLAAGSWRALMLDLENHFDNDASLDEEPAAEILAYLQENAGKSSWLSKLRVGEDNLRVTGSRWFVHEHDDISSAVWQREAIASASNCTACHTKAKQGNFDENYVRIPK